MRCPTTCEDNANDERGREEGECGGGDLGCNIGIHLNLGITAERQTGAENAD